MRGDVRKLEGTAACVIAVALSALSSTLAPEAEAGRIAPGCWGGRTHAIGSPQRVNAIPNGCVWVLQPLQETTRPVLSTRISGRTARHPLPRAPVANTRGVCGVSRFVVQWPYVTVAADSVWDGQNDCVSSFDAAATWVMRWDGRTFRRAFTSPPRGG